MRGIISSKPVLSTLLSREINDNETMALLLDTGRSASGNVWKRHRGGALGAFNLGIAPQAFLRRGVHAVKRAPLPPAILSGGESPGLSGSI